MGILVITVDLDCCRCRAKITKVLECLKEEFCIEKIEFEDKKEKKVVVVRGKFDPHKLCKKIWCKAGKVVKEIIIVEVWPPPPPKPKECKPCKECCGCEHCKPKPEKCSCCCVCGHCKPKPKPEEKPKPPPPKPQCKLVPFPFPYPMAMPGMCPPNQQCQCCPKPPPKPPCGCSSHDSCVCGWPPQPPACVWPPQPPVWPPGPWPPGCNVDENSCSLM